jgi:sugar lactone lactonase YvrE
VRRLAPAVLVLVLALPASAASARARWDTQVLALVPRPGFPALAYVHPNGHVYEGTYDNPSGDTVPSRVFDYTADGTLQHSWTVQGQDLSQPHGVQVATSDPQGRLVLLDKSPARALLLDTGTGRQTTYATFADLPNGGTPMPDYAAWGPDGSLYVTDYQQDVLWRVPPGGGVAQPWLTDPRLDGGGMFGTAGIELMADRRTLLLSQASSAGFGELNPTTGKLYKVAIQADGRPGAPAKVWESGPAEAPDGFAIAKSGRVYLALVSPDANQLVVIAADGKEIERFPQSPGGGENGSSVPFDSPSSVMFLGTSVIVANQSYVNGDATHQAILDVETGEEGLTPFIPPAPARPTVPHKKATKKQAKRKKHRRHHRRHRRHHR